MMVRTLGTVSAGVCFFPPQVFFRQGPSGQKRKHLMAVPTPPVANLILGKAGGGCLAAEHRSIVAVVTDDPAEVAVPVWPRRDIEAVADRILALLHDGERAAL
jgi:hypothetical protein